MDDSNQYSNMDGAKVTSFNPSPAEWEAIKTAFLEAWQERLNREAVSGNEGYKVRVEAILTSQITNRKILTLNDLASS